MSINEAEGNEHAKVEREYAAFVMRMIRREAREAQDCFAEATTEATPVELHLGRICDYVYAYLEGEG